jgi:hypothetical protein
MCPGPGAAGGCDAALRLPSWGRSEREFRDLKEKFLGSGTI